MMNLNNIYLSGPIIAVAVAIAVIFIVIYFVSMNKTKKEIESREKDIQTILNQLPTVDKIDVPIVDVQVDSNAQLKSFVVAKAAEKSPELARVIRDSDVKTVPVVDFNKVNEIPAESSTLPSRNDFFI